MTALLMFSYSFLAIASYNIIKPITKSKFIEGLGADNLPYVILGAAVLIGILMQGYSTLMSVLPRRWASTIVQAGMAGVMVLFWFLFQSEAVWVPVAFYFFGLIVGVLLISQFWTLANIVYDPRQAKRLFGFIGGGAPLGGIAASALVSGYTTQIGTVNFLIISALLLLICSFIVTLIVQREKPGEEAAAKLAAAGKNAEEGVSGAEAIRLLRGSKHLQIIALIIGFAAIGAAIIDQQLSMAAADAAAKSSGNQTDYITSFLGQVQLWMSTIAFIIQIWLTSKIHRLLGIGFALMVLPFSLGGTAVVMLFTAALWSSALARVVDQSLRYTVDKTSREILFLPLPADLKYKAKPFVDVTVDRFAKGAGALLALILIKPWGANLQWWQISYASLVITGLWIMMALVARKGYLAAFRKSIERQDVQAAELRLDVADLSTIETLMEELASPDERRVLYAIDILESLEKRNLITPLLLYHEAAAVRARALQALGATTPEAAERWLPNIQRMISDPSADVRAAAVSALARIKNEQVTEFIRPYLRDRDPRIATTAAVVLARSTRPEDVTAAETVLTDLAGDTREAAAEGRRNVASAIRQIADDRFRHVLIPLLYDPDAQVAEEAMKTVREAGSSEYVFVPTLVSLLRHRGLKASARDVLVSYGEPVLDTLNYFLRDPEEDMWVRRHLPATVALIPVQKSMDILVDALSEPDGFLRYKAVSAIEKLRREHPELTFKRETIEAMALAEGNRYFTYLTLYYNLFERAKLSKDTLLARALNEKIGRTVDRVYKLLGLIYPWKDIEAARYAIEHGETRSRASALEYLDNILTGPIRKRLMPMLEEMPLEEKVRKANVLLKTRPRDVEETLLQLINEDDQILSAAAIDLVEENKIWALADDIEHVLEHRDAKDWYVFEAASWALAAHRMPESKRRQLWVEPLPAVQLASRLRQVPLFASVSVDELFRVANTGRQVRHEAGRVLYQEGAVPEQVQFLLDGAVTGKGHGVDAHQMTPPAALGLEQALEGSAMPEAIRTTEASVCLALTTDEVRTLVADNTELVQGLFRMLVGQGATERVVIPGPATSPIANLAPGPLTPIDKVVVLETVPLFSGLTAEETLALGSIARETQLAEGSTLFGESDAPAVYAVLSGLVRLESAGTAPITSDAGDIIGLFETLAGIPLERKGQVVQAGRAMRIDREELFDLLAQRPVLLQQLFSALFRSSEPQPVTT